MNRVTAVIVAAGSGRRFGSAKQFAPLGGKPVLDWSLEAFSRHPRIDGIVLVLPEADAGRSFTEAYPKITARVKGGARRQDSVGNGLRAISGPDSDLVLVHDGARPLVTPDLISRIIDEAERSGAAVPVLPLDDTVKETEAGLIVRTLDRSKLVRAQTPQGFSLGRLRTAFKEAAAVGFYGTDEAALVERLGEKIRAIPGDPRNIKITTGRDLVWAEASLHV